MLCQLFRVYGKCSAGFDSGITTTRQLTSQPARYFSSTGIISIVNAVEALDIASIKYKIHEQTYSACFGLNV